MLLLYLIVCWLGEIAIKISYGTDAYYAAEPPSLPLSPPSTSRLKTRRGEAPSASALWASPSVSPRSFTSGPRS